MTERQQILYRLRNLSEYETVRHISELNSINKIHTSNYLSLKNQLEKLPSLKSSLPGNQFSISIYAKIEKNKYNFELLQFLNNYLSSAFSLVDLTRKHYEKYYNGNKLQEYKEKIKTDFANNPFHKFIQEFRNYALHYSVPTLSITKKVNYVNDGETTEHYVTLNLKELKESSFNWTSLSKKYIESRESDSIDILNLFNDYYNLLNDSQNWYRNKQKELYAQEFKVIEKAEIDFSTMMFEELMTHINSGKGYSYNMVENMLLHCFNFDCQTEILSCEDSDKRLNLILTKLDSTISISPKDFTILKITLSKNPFQNQTIN